MKRKWLLLLLAIGGSLVGGLIVCGCFFWHKRSPSFPSPYPQSILGRGFIEPCGTTTHIGTPIPGVVEEVYVKTGDYVRQGDPLFQIDRRELFALLAQAEACQKKAVAVLARLEREPRAELLPPLEAQVKQAKMRLSEEAIQYGLFQHVSDKRAISFSDYTERKYQAAIARYELEKAKADLALVQAGAWEEDIKVAQASVEEAKASVAVVETNLQRTLVCAPSDGQILKVDVNKGDFAVGSYEDNYNSDPLLVFAKISPLHLRVEIDQDEACKVFSGARAVAYVRGKHRFEIPLEFVRINPCIVDVSIGQATKRVLEIIYRFEKKDLPIYLGQLVDVYVEARAL